MRSSQMKFLDPRLKKMAAFGGSLLATKRGKLRMSNPKTKRPLSTKHAIHLVLKSSLARGDWSFRSIKNKRSVDESVRRHAHKYGVRVYEFANVGTHLHLLIRVKNRFTYQPFIRALTGHLSQIVTGARKGIRLKKKFWDFRPFSRVVEWKRAYSVVKDYLILNQLEALGVISRKPIFTSTA